jgi:hypothetical protein
MKTVHLAGAILAAAVALTTVASAQDIAAPAAPITARDIAGRGAFKADRQNPMPMQRWDLQVTRGDDNSISGRVNLGGSPLANAGKVQGHIVGTNVSGTVTDDDGNKVASFTGTVTANGITGVYTDRTGETGSWSWDGPPPK